MTETPTGKTQAERTHEQRTRIKASHMMVWFLCLFSLVVTGLAISQQNIAAGTVGVGLAFAAAALGLGVSKMRQTLEEMTHAGTT